MSGRRQRRRAERIERRVEAGRDVDALLDAMRPHLAAIGDDLAAVTDPFEAELAASAMLGLLTGLEPLASADVARRLVDDVAGQRDTAARALLRFMALSPDPDLAALARRADAALAATGVTGPAWTDAVTEPVRPTRFTKITVVGDRLEAWLLALFHRSGVEHGFLVGVDFADCGAITAVDPVPPARVGDLVAKVDTGRLWQDLPTETEDLEHPAARRLLDAAIAATLDHWRGADSEDLEADLLPGRLILLGRRLHQAGPAGVVPGRGAHTPPLAPPRRGPAPILRLDARLNGAEPPIWRHLDVPGDTPLAGLHELLQAAFGWTGAHTHRFVTVHGDYRARPDLGCEDEAAITVDQVLTGPGVALTYRYDPVADWEHRVAVVDTVEPAPDAHYPRCTAGGEPSPPEDIGGIGAWQRLRDALDDPTHPEHRQLVDEQNPDDLRPPDLDAINDRLKTPGRPER